MARDRAGNVVSDVSDGVFMILSSSVAGVDDGPVTAFALAAPRPNPVRGSGAIVFALPTATHVRLAVLDVQGREVAVLADGLYAAGRHPVTLSSARLEPGLYFARLEAAGRRFTQRIVLMR